MAVTCVDGQGVAPHITGADKGRLHAGIFGETSVVLGVGKKLEATQDGANKVTIATGDAIIHGRHVSVTIPEQVTIQSGTQGQNRNDLICLKYERNAQGIETAKLEVLRGTPTTETPKDPTIPVGNVLAGDAQDYFALYRVKLNGIVANKPEPLYTIVSTLFDKNSHDFELFAIQDVEGSYKNYWHVYRTGDSVTIQFRGWLGNNTSYDAIKCPITIPEGSRPPEVDGALYPFDDHEHIYYGTGFCPGNAGVITAISARPDGSIYLQDMGGTPSRDWRMGVLTYTVAH